MLGWSGAILRVNVGTGKVKKEPLNKDLARGYIGGRLLNLKYLFDEVRPGIEALGPGNKVIFSVGPACGTLVPGSSRFTVTAKSPLSGFIGDASCGGPFAIGLKRAGYDALIIEGKANKPVYLWIEDDSVELREAGHLKGKPTSQTEKIIQKENGSTDVQVASIGPAGEERVRFACLMSHGRSAGRTGIGAVMGSKNLKAIAARGTGGVRVADRKLLEETVSEIYQEWRDQSKDLASRRSYGPGVPSFATYSKLGIVGARNYRDGVFPAAEAFPSRLAADYYVSPSEGCFSCPIACHNTYVVTSGPYAGTKGENVVMAAMQFGPRLGIPELDFVLKAASLSDEYGLDFADTAQAIAYVMDCFEAGILTAKDLGGLRAEWGSHDAALKLMEAITFRKGIGDILAEGVNKAAKIIGKGSDRFAMTVKGLSIDSRDPRGSKGWALAYAVGSRGGDHCRHLLPDFATGGIPTWFGKVIEGYQGIDRFSEEGKAELLKWHEDARGFEHCLEMCLFAHPYATKEPYPVPLAKLYSAVTGVPITADEVNAFGERLTNLERVYNIREGLTRRDDTLPARFFKEPMTDGPSKDRLVNLDFMLDRYYELRGWDKAGFPTRAKLEHLGLTEAADELDKYRVKP